MFDSRKDSKNITVGIGLLLLPICVTYFYENHKANAAQKAESNQRTVKFGERVLSLENLDRAKTFADLNKYGLVAPEQRNHKAGKNLILLALQATAFPKR